MLITQRLATRFNIFEKTAIFYQHLVFYIDFQSGTHHNFGFGFAALANSPLTSYIFLNK